MCRFQAQEFAVLFQQLSGAVHIEGGLRPAFCFCSALQSIREELGDAAELTLMMVDVSDFG